ncbi:MAG: 4Fe-4S dicluster domain-containing protein [Planctomycetes bacterium]|nr:4Fe-4S dicluster domain-containing protein [Planctomycetota bacterium]
MPAARVLAKFCKGCQLCISVCPKGTLELSKSLNEQGIHIAVVKADAQCTGCLNCVQMCPDAAIAIAETP